MEDNSILALPFVPLRDMVVFPELYEKIDIGREMSLGAVNYAMEHDRLLVVSCQLNPEVENPTIDDVYQIGTLVRIEQLLRLPGGIVRIMVTGLDRVSINGFSVKDDYIEVAVVKQPSCDAGENEDIALSRVMTKRFYNWLDKLKNQEEVREKVGTIQNRSVLTDYIASQLPIATAAMQGILEYIDVRLRMRHVCSLLDMEVDIAKIEAKLNNQVRGAMNQQQKEYYLREKIKAIHNELGDSYDRDEEIQKMRDKVAKLKLPTHVKEVVDKEISRLNSMPPMMQESAIIMTYLDWVLALPWSKQSKDRLDLKEAQTILDEDHYGLKEVKDRIIEYLAVRLMSKSTKGPILCFVGPPGTGKTSIARSIAKAMNREYVRISLGGVRDEAEIRGHRRTYIGALPGRIISGIKQAGTKNPVFLLDEIDKMTSDLRGDPSSALLEVLDPEQNNTFSDHFIEIPFDLSKVFWITTANVISDIPRPLLDRMEIIEFSSYTEEEKLEIAKRYLVPKQLKQNGLTSYMAKFSATVLRHIIQDYTRESGVRTLEKTIGKVCRKIVKSYYLNPDHPLTVSMKNLETLLGPVKFLPTKISKDDEVGRVTGLAWTQVGGEILDTEVACLKGKGNLILTGQLGDVMKESAEAGMTYIRSRAHELGLADDFYTTTDIHIHLPEGAVPKDGPSAGITMATAIASALTGRKVHHDLAMTGEITLRGNVLPVGGIKEKVIAAHRSGIKKILLPEENKRDMVQVPQSVKDDVSFVFVHHMDEVLREALVKS